MQANQQTYVEIQELLTEVKKRAALLDDRFLLYVISLAQTSSRDAGQSSCH
ncbi:MAG: hypothetical protein JKY49_14225 [Cohaesibacteraceae bacterium]|nr:hypothetical protein [Cohaesibacteraceae bacterium]MBL4875427.1 hypothetical protein [Cohaesibacteraceae bacterium]